MPDREKVIKALEFCTDQRIVDTCYGECPYAVADDEYKCLQMKLDALALLKEQDETIKRYEHFIGKFTDPDVEEQPCPPPPKPDDEQNHDLDRDRYVLMTTGFYGTGGDVNGKGKT